MIDDFDLDEIKALLGDSEESVPESVRPVEHYHDTPVNARPEPPEREYRKRGDTKINTPQREHTQAAVYRKSRDEIIEISGRKTVSGQDNYYTSVPEENSRIITPPEEDIPDPDELRRARIAAKRAKAEERKRRRTGVKRGTPFFITLALITVLAWIIPLRPTVSESEKRNLAEFPEFSAKSLFSGDFFSDIDSWFSDTFTFRESWISVANNFKECYGIRSVALYDGVAPNSDDVISDSPETGEDDYGEPETDITDDFLISAGFIDETEPEESEPEEAENDVEQENHEPEEEDAWGGVVIDEDEYVNARTVLIVGNESFRKTAYSEDGCNRFAALANKTGDLLEGKANFYVLLVPENGTTKLTKEDRLYYGFELEEDGFELVFSQLNDNVKKVNCIDRLIKHNSEYTVFRTDHHWTALGAYYAYEEWCSVAGVDPVPLSEYKELEFPGFLGTYYYSTGNNKHLGDTPDTVYAYEPPGNIDMYMNRSSTSDGMGGKTKSLLLDVTKGTPGRKYMTFLGTDEARITFINNDITDGSAVMVIKTSFGNPFVYYLTQHYQYVYVVDYRYYHGRCITSFVEHFDIDDVIIVGGLGFVAERGGQTVLKAYMK